jgi:hypothetical protein
MVRPYFFGYRGALLSLFLVGTMGAKARAEERLTREYWLKSTDAIQMIQAINIVIRNPTQQRIMGGQGKHLVITDAPEQLGQIAEIIPVMDQPSKETKPQRIVMEMVGRAGMYMRDNQKSAIVARKSDSPTATPAPSVAIKSGINSYDTFRSTTSVYAEEDARILKQQRHLVDEPVLMSLGDLTLKGIFEPEKGNRMGLLAIGTALYTARDGGLFESNRTRIKGISSQVLADQVILVGADRIPRKFKFKSTL